MTKKMTKKELIAQLKQAANDVSFYNAAEGSAWYTEARARSKAKIRFNDAWLACEAAGIDLSAVFNRKDYLL